MLLLKVPARYFLWGKIIKKGIAIFRRSCKKNL